MKRKFEIFLGILCLLGCLLMVIIPLVMFGILDITIIIKSIVTILCILIVALVFVAMLLKGINLLLGSGDPGS